MGFHFESVKGCGSLRSKTVIAEQSAFANNCSSIDIKIRRKHGNFETQDKETSIYFEIVFTAQDTESNIVVCQAIGSYVAASKEGAITIKSHSECKNPDFKISEKIIKDEIIFSVSSDTLTALYAAMVHIKTISGPSVHITDENITVEFQNASS